ncbi:hypothetical protein [Thermococcus sp.]
MKLKAIPIIVLIMFSLGCIDKEVNTQKPAIELKPVVDQASFNQSIESVEYFLLEIQREYILPWKNESVTVSERVPILFLKMKNGSWLIGAQELEGNVFLLQPGTDGYGRLYSCHCIDGKIIDFKVTANIYSFHNMTSFQVNYEVKNIGSGEYTFETIGYSIDRVKIFGKTYTMKLGEIEGTWRSNEIMIEPLGNYTYRVQVQGENDNRVKTTLSIIPILLTGGKENVTLTTIPLDVEVVKSEK